MKKSTLVIIVLLCVAISVTVGVIVYSKLPQGTPLYISLSISVTTGGLILLLGGLILFVILLERVNASLERLVRTFDKILEEFKP